MQAIAAIVKFFLGLLLVCAAAWGIARLAPPSAEEREALARVTAPWHPAGTDAFDAIYLSGHDVPAAKRRELVDADLLAADPGGRAGDAAERAGMPAAAIAEADRKRLCGREDADCIAKVAADREGLATLLAGHPVLLRNLAELRRHGHVRNRNVRVNDPIPPFQHVHAPVTAHALRFLSGDVAGALAETCADLALWRRFAANEDALIGTMVAEGGVERYGALLGGIVARTPRGAALPADCAAAVAAPAEGEGDVALAVAGEFRYMDDINRQVFADDWWWKHVMYDADGTRALMATTYAAFSTPAVRADIAADRRVSLPPRARFGWRDWRCIANVTGCIVHDMGGPDEFLPYAWRMQDHRARLQVLGALAWLRAQPPSDEPLAAMLARWPGQWPAPARQVEATAGGRALRIAMFYRKRGDEWTLPAPGSLVDGGAPASAPAAAPVSSAAPAPSAATAPGPAPDPADRFRRT